LLSEQPVVRLAREALGERRRRALLVEAERGLLGSTPPASIAAAGRRDDGAVQPGRIVDCHVHVFDPQRFPYRSDTFYAPTGQELGMPARLCTVLDAHGVGHALLVGPNSGCGEDNQCLLDTLAGGAGRYRGMAVVPNATSRGELADLRAAGVLGVTLNAALLGVEHYADGGGSVADLAALDMIAEVQVTGDQFVALAPLLGRSGVRVWVDHLGRPDPAAGVDAALGFRRTAALGGRGPRGRQTLRVRQGVPRARPHADLARYLRALLAEFGPDRCVWGSDWPFLRMPERVDYGPLLALIADQVADADALRRISLGHPVPGARPRPVTPVSRTARGPARRRSRRRARLVPAYSGDRRDRLDQRGLLSGGGGPDDVAPWPLLVSTTCPDDGLGEQPLGRCARLVTSDARCWAGKELRHRSFTARPAARHPTERRPRRAAAFTGADGRVRSGSMSCPLGRPTESGPCCGPA
jgi:predicted TIM-barrel fold metal-dependent hydrolase